MAIAFSDPEKKRLSVTWLSLFFICHDHDQWIGLFGKIYTENPWDFPMVYIRGRSAFLTVPKKTIPLTWISQDLRVNIYGKDDEWPFVASDVQQNGSFPFPSDDSSSAYNTTKKQQKSTRVNRSVLNFNELSYIPWRIRMYAIYGNIYHQFSIYTIHGSYGYMVQLSKTLPNYGFYEYGYP